MGRMNRREFLRTGAAGLAATAAGAAALRCVSAAAEAPRGRRPNIVFILTDDQRWDALGCLGHPFLRTPNLDRLRNEGALLANAFVTTSLCSPSRASFLTGTYASTHGVMINELNDFDPSATPSFPQLLRDRGGYRTAFVGKWHLDSTHANPRAGFDTWLSFTGQGVYTNPTLNENGKTVKREGYITDILSDYACNWIETSSQREAPFCLFLSHKAVHAPFEPAARHKGTYADVEIAEPPNFNDSRRGKPAWLRTRWSDRLRSGAAPEVVESVPKRRWKPKGYHKSYMETILAVDDGVGRVLDTLEKAGELDNTMIIFAGDNGFFLGEHSRGDKRLAYEESMRIPMLIRYPRLAEAGATVEGMVLNIDVAPTLLALAGVKAPAVMQGRSFAPLLADPDAPWRKSFLYEYWRDRVPAIPRMIAVRTDRWKLITTPDRDDVDELYDLAADPHELTNLAARPEHAARLAELRREMDRLVKVTGYRRKVPTDISPKPRETVLDLDFDAVAEGKLPDRTAAGNHGRIQGATAAEGRSGRALSFDGSASVQFAGSPSLDCSLAPWAVEAWIKPDGDGVIAAQGGKRRGWLLFVENGVPGFAVREMPTTLIADARENRRGHWTHVVGAFTDEAVAIYVNGKLVDSIAPLHLFRANPTDPLSIGRDLGSPVDEKLSATGYRGLIDHLRIHRIAMNEKRVAKLYADTRKE